MRPSSNLENKILSETCSRVQLIRMNVQDHTFSEPPLEYNQDQTRLTNQDFGYDLLKQLEGYINNMQTQIFSRSENR